MFRYLKKITLYFSAILVVISICFVFNKIALRNSNILRKEHNHTLILGASRTAWSLDDHQLDHALNVSSNGDGLFYSFIKLKLLKKINPEINQVILSFDSRTLNSRLVDIYYNSNSLRTRLPIYIHHFTFTELFEITGSDYYSLMKSLILIPKYSLGLLKTTILGAENITEELDLGGYRSISRNIMSDPDGIENFIKNDSTRNYQLSTLEMEHLAKITRFCDSNDIKLIFINPPMHDIMYNSIQYQEGKKLFENYYKTYLNQYEYWDYSNDFLPDSCYADLIHLNKIGAAIFSNKVKARLKQNNYSNQLKNK